MGKKWLLSLSLVVLSGCAQFPDLEKALRGLTLAGAQASTNTPDTTAQGQFWFDWSLSGDRSIAPLQVFDNGRQTWLQFSSGHPVPAVFARIHVQPGASGATERGGDRLLAWRQHGDFVVIDEVPELLVFRGGHLRAEARRGKDAVSMPAPLAMSEPIAPVMPSSTLETPALPEGGIPIPARSAASHLENVVPEPKFAALSAAPSTFSVSRTDGNLRQVLARWALSSGWDFGPEHWMVDVDIPIIGSASFDLPFVDAVRALVSSTELADRPLQPCFYSNRVLRVVPYTQTCNRMTASVVSS